MEGKEFEGATFSEKIIKRENLKNSLSPREKTLEEKRVRFEQMLLHKSKTEIAQNFKALLVNIKQLVDTLKFETPLVYTSYAWPSDNLPHEQWTKSFITLMVDDLRAAGLTIHIDSNNSPTGNNSIRYMHEMKKYHFILIIGTESLKYKQLNGIHAIHTELNLIDQTRRDNIETIKILPYLLSGKYQTAFPDNYMGYIVIDSFIDKESYLQVLQKMIGTFYGLQTNQEYQTLWENFAKNCAIYNTLSNESVTEFEKNLLEKEKTEFKTKQKKEKNLLKNHFSTHHSPHLFFRSPKLYHAMMLSVPDKNLDYVTRNTIEEKIGEKIKQENKVVLYGLSGIGKTQLALNYSYKNRGNYSLILWVTAETPYQITLSYQQIAIQLQLIESEDIDNIVEFMKNWFESQEKMLLIFDNANNFEELKPFLPKENCGIITTSRQRNWPSRILIEVKVMLENEAEKLVKTITKIEESNNISKLIQRLDYLPLALIQASAYIFQHGSSIDEYIKLYEENKEILDYPKLPNSDEKSSVWLTWSHSMDCVKQSNPFALNIIKLICFFSPHNIPKDVLRKLPHLSQEKNSILKFNECIKTLKDYLLITADPETKFISVHRLIQDLMYNSMKEEEKKTWILMASSLLLQTYKKYQLTNSGWLQTSTLIPHMEIAAKWVKEHDITTIITTELFICLIRFLIQSDHLQTENSYEKATEYFKQLEKLISKIPLENHATYIEIEKELREKINTSKISYHY